MISSLTQKSEVECDACDTYGRVKMQDKMFRLNIKQKNERMTMLFFAFSKPSGVFSLITVYGEVSEVFFF